MRSNGVGKLEGRVALVTGAGRGIGRAIAERLADEGASLVLNDLDDGPLGETVADVVRRGAAAIAVPGSVTASDLGDRLIDAAVSGLGGLDIVVNNAGYTWDGVIQKVGDDQWHDILEVHLTAPFRILRAAQPVLKDAAAADARAGRVEHRKVVNVSSLAGLYGNAGQVNYATAKAGVVGMTKTLAKEWGRFRVNVNAVAFGLIETRLTEGVAGGDQASIDIEGRQIAVGVNPQVLAAATAMIPLGRAGTPREAAGAVALLTYPEADYISGQTIVCGGGYEA